MKKVLTSLFVGALAALLLFSDCERARPQVQYEAASVNIGSNVGLVYPTDYIGCYRPTQNDKETPLPKNVPNATWYNTGSPPLKYQQDVRVTIYFDNPNKINRTAHNGAPICGMTLFAYTYTDKKEIHLPNPCTYPQTDAYARLACHEMGHANGWPGYHGDK